MRRKKNGFTLIEMLIVLIIISALLLLILPNVMQHTESAQGKGREAQRQMIENQVMAYQMDDGNVPTMEQLIARGYLKVGQNQCADQREIIISTNGNVSIK